MEIYHLVHLYRDNWTNNRRYSMKIPLHHRNHLISHNWFYIQYFAHFHKRSIQCPHENMANMFPHQIYQL